ncbi:MAG: hypothetical protein QOF39_201 [Frankiales bacterium]|nr:hypothetical protein [Frankiales bacterium]
MGIPVYPFVLPPEPGAEGQILTELRIHGVSGPDPAGVLESPAVFHVAGDAITGFARRLGGNAYGATDLVDPAAPHRRLEAFSWRGVSSGAASRSLWLLLTPFAFLNIAAWMHPIPPEDLPPEVSAQVGPYDLPRRDPWHDRHVVVLHSLLRALAVGLTLLLVLATLAATEDIPYRSTHVACPGSLSTVTCGRVYRVGGLVATGGVLLLLHILAKVTWKRYEARKATSSRSAFMTPLASPSFWDVKPSVHAQERVHMAAGAGLIGWVGAQPSLRGSGVLSVTGLSIGVAAVMGILAWPRFSMAGDLGRAEPLTEEAAKAALKVGGGTSGSPYNSGPASPFDPMREPPPWWSWVRGSAPGRLVGGLAVVAAVVGVVLGVAAVVRSAAHGSHPTVPRPAGDLFRVRPALGVLLAALTALMAAVFVVVALMRRRAPANRNHRPMLGGWAAALMPPVAFLVSGVLSSAAVLAASKVFDHKARHIITPGFAELANVGSSVVLLTVVAAAGFMVAFMLTSRRRYNDVLVDARVRHPEDRPAYRKACGTAHVVRSGYRAVPLLTLGALVWMVTTLVVVITGSRPYAAALLLTLFALAVAGLPGLLITVFRNVGKRRAVGVVWDVTTFWPRAVHPLAPPCYAERVIPQLVSRIDALEERGPVLVSGHSQGAMISSALFQQLPTAETNTALVTYGCQLSFLFARAFPSYCGGFVLDQLASDLGVPSGDQPGQPSRWLNLFRLTDLLGSTVFLSTSYCDVNREVSDPRYARYIQTPADQANPRLSLQAPAGPVSGDLITSTRPLGHSDYPASYEYRLAARQLDAVLGHGTP